MTIFIKVNDAGNLEIDTDSLLQHLSSTQRDLAVQSLSCRDDIIRNVMEQVFSGYTDDGYCGSHSTITEKPWTPLDIFRRRIAHEAGVVHSTELAGMEKTLARRQEELDILNRELDSYKYPRTL